MKKLFVLSCLVLPFFTSGQEMILRDSLTLEDLQLAADNTAIDLDDDNVSENSSYNVASLLTAGRDPFLNAASFNFNIARFRMRGYSGDLSSLYMNGISMNNADNGNIAFSAWSGLNDVMRSKDVSVGFSPNTFCFGEAGTSTFIDARASKQRRQTLIGYSYSNRSYQHRISFTHNTGFNSKGWAFSLSGSYRYAAEGYVPGTYYYSGSYHVGIDKRIRTNQLLSLVVFGAPTTTGRQGASVIEMQQIAKTNYYNPYWGYQNGKKRNANESFIHQPYAILTHDFRLNNTTSLVTAAGVSIGRRINTGIDWYNAPDPRPDYYKYLPSYYQSDSVQYQQILERLQNGENARQINWQHFYDVNRNSFEIIHDANGIKGNNIAGKRSNYIVENRVNDSKRFVFNSTINTSVGRHLALTAGLEYQFQINHYYKTVNDLLGGDFYVNLNQFAQAEYNTNQNAIQNDIDHPNRILYVNDRFGYDYNMQISKGTEWMQLLFKFNHIDFFVGGDFTFTQFYRNGNVRNGLFAGNSFGKSATNTFLNSAVKAGITYKINGRNYLFANASWLTKAPYMEDVFVSPATRNQLQTDITSKEIRSAEGGYILNAPAGKIRLRGYYTTINRGMDVLRFYHDEFKCFVNYSLKNINEMHYGGELGVDIKLFKNVSFNAAAALGRYYYKGRQKAIVTADNTTSVLEETTIYTDGFRIPSTPQEAYSAGLAYRSQRNWFITATANYFDQSWLSFNPLRRTVSTVDGLGNDDKLLHAIIDQEKTQPQYTVDVFAGYTLLMRNKQKKSKALVFYASANNVLDNQHLISGGYEQLRFDAADRDVNKFPSKYYHAFGRTFFLSTAFRF